MVTKEMKVDRISSKKGDLGETKNKGGKSLQEYYMRINKYVKI